MDNVNHTLLPVLYGPSWNRVECPRSHDLASPSKAVRTRSAAPDNQSEPVWTVDTWTAPTPVDPVDMLWVTRSPRPWVKEPAVVVHRSPQDDALPSPACRQPRSRSDLRQRQMSTASTTATTTDQLSIPGHPSTHIYSPDLWTDRPHRHPTGGPNHRRVHQDRATRVLSCAHCGCRE